MSISYIRERYNVPAKIGGEILFTDGEGLAFNCTIFSTSGCHLKVRINGNSDKKHYWLLHPTWNIKYIFKVKANDT